jgi:hypothetical protein
VLEAIADLAMIFSKPLAYILFKKTITEVLVEYEIFIF